jgi:class 3 adenylate cyclase
VLFADLVGFTPWANRTDPATIVELLDDLFTRYDALVDAAGVEKVKTVGDAYMAVAGAPQPRDDHAAVALEVARQMLHTLATWREDRGVEMETRIGLASGPVVAGVIGRRRLLFDLWGDTVNTASRMQSHGVPGRIQLAEATRLRLPNVEAEARDVEVKGLGTLRAYLVR